MMHAYIRMHNACAVTHAAPKCNINAPTSAPTNMGPVLVTAVSHHKHICDTHAQQPTSMFHHTELFIMVYTLTSY